MPDFSTLQWPSFSGGRQRQTSGTSPTITMTGNELLQNASKISHHQVLQKTTEEYNKFKEQSRNEITEVEKHFIKEIEEVFKNVLIKYYRFCFFIQRFGTIFKSLVNNLMVI